MNCVNNHVRLKAGMQKDAVILRYMQSSFTACHKQNENTQATTELKYVRFILWIKYFYNILQYLRSNEIKAIGSNIVQHLIRGISKFLEILIAIICKKSIQSDGASVILQLSQYSVYINSLFLFSYSQCLRILKKTSFI